MSKIDIDSITLEIKRLENIIEGKCDIGVKGILVDRYIRCGKPNCKCNDAEFPEKHGPYPNIQYYDNKGKLRNLYIKKSQKEEYELKLKQSEEFISTIKELNKLYLLKRKYL